MKITPNPDPEWAAGISLMDLEASFKDFLWSTQTVVCGLGLILALVSALYLAEYVIHMKCKRGR
jgi:hypothetical protein